MKIAVFNCPYGVTAGGILKAFLDLGLPKKHRPDKQAKDLICRILKALEHAKIYDYGKDELKQAAEAALAIRYFGIEKCFVRNLAIGKKGNARTLKLLRGFTLERLPVNEEIVTPVGAAILSVLCERESSIPAMRFEGVGFGPNHLQISLGQTVAPYRRERILLLETNIDDMSPQGFELLYERLFKAGALDVWIETILMKKMRPSFKLSVLLNHTAQDKISEVVFRETPSLGVRFLELDRFSLPRKSLRRKTRFGPVRFKIGFLNGHPLPARPEYEDLKRISKRKGIPFRRIAEILSRRR